MKLRGGIDLDDADDPKKYQKANLNDAARHRTNTQKDLDSMFFSGPAPVRRKKPQQQQEKQKIVESYKQITSTIIEEQPVTVTKQISIKVQVQSSQQGQRVSSKSGQKIVRTSPPQKSTNLKNQSASSLNKKSQEKISINERQPKRQVKRETKPIVIQSNVQKKLSSGKLLNRPKYIRKLKNIAGNIFQKWDKNKFRYEDVVRMFQCEKKWAHEQKQQELFEDRFFPAVSLSIGYKSKKLKSEWKKPAQIFRKPCFGKYIDPNDIELGKMSSRTFMSVVSCLAEKQKNIKRLIDDQQVNRDGFYYVRLNINGVWRYVPVDDYLPYLNGEAIFAKSFNDQESDLWVSLIEKAYAKMFAGYETFERSIPPQNYLQDLTGAIVREYSSSDKNILKIVRQSLNQGYVVIGVPKSKIFDVGMDPRNCLGVIGVNADKIQFRNSWGVFTQKSQISFSNLGAFTLNSTWVESLIDRFLVAEINEAECSSTIQSKHHKGFYCCYSMRVNEALAGTFSISQWDQQLFGSHLNYKYSPFRIIIERKQENNKNTYVASGFSYDRRQLDLDVNLEGGQYYIYCIGSWNNTIYDYNLTFRGKELVEFWKVKLSDRPNLIASSLQQLSIQYGKKSSKGSVNEYLYYHEDSNLLILTVKNVTKSSVTHVQDLSEINFNNLSLLGVADPTIKFDKMFKEQIDEKKQSELKDRKWTIKLEPLQEHSWIISTNMNYDGSNLRKWGFK